MKNDYKHMNVKQLTEELNNLQEKRVKLECYCRRNLGSSTLVRNYPKKSDPNLKEFGNIKNIKKNIARIKTFLHVKMKYVKQ